MLRLDRSRVIQKAMQKRPAASPAPTRTAERQKKWREEAGPTPSTEGGSDRDGLPLIERQRKLREEGRPTPAVKVESDSDALPLADVYPQIVAEVPASHVEAMASTIPKPAPAGKGKHPAVEAKAEGGSESDTVMQQEGTERWNALDDPRWARSLLRGAMIDADWEVSIQWSIADVPMETYHDFMRVLHGISLMDNSIRHVVQTAKVSAKRVQELEAVLEVAEASQRSAEEGLAAARTEAASTKEARKKAKDRLADCRARLEKKKERVPSLTNKLAKEEGRSAKAEEKLKEAWEQVRAAQAESVRLGIQLKESQESASRQIQGAVEAYKASRAFTKDVEDAAANFYREGYDDALKKMKELFPELDLVGAELGAPSDMEGAEVGPTVESVADPGSAEEARPAAEARLEEEAQPDVASLGAILAEQTEPPSIVVAEVEVVTPELSPEDRT